MAKNNISKQTRQEKVPAPITVCYLHTITRMHTLIPERKQQEHGQLRGHAVKLVAAQNQLTPRQLHHREKKIHTK